ncbi:MAG: arylsulfatase, partial [Verrucomicrobiota bacterium]
ARAKNAPLFWQWNRHLPDLSHNAAMRQGNWKLVHPFVTRALPKTSSPEPPQLFNLTEDPGENENLSELQPDLVREMESALKTWFTAVEGERKRDIP